MVTCIPGNSYGPNPSVPHLGPVLKGLWGQAHPLLSDYELRIILGGGGGTENDNEAEVEEEDLKGELEGMSIVAQPGGQEAKPEDPEPTAASEKEEGTTKVVESGAFTISSTINRYGHYYV